MAKSPGITQVQVTDTFQAWLNKTNELVTLVNSDVLTASPGGDTTVGNATLTGNFTANNFTANAAIGVFTGFTGRFSNIQQQIGNNAPINVASMLSITVANTIPIRLVNSLGPRIAFNNTNRIWEIGHSTGSINSSFAFVREGVTLAAISANGDWEGTGSITANGVITTGNAGRVLVGNGSIAIPSVAFINAPNTGIYFSANAIGFSVGNSMKMNIANSGILTLAYGIRSANGTAAIPAHSFNGFGHTGAWYNGNYNISVNGSINMEIGQTGSFMFYGTGGVQLASNTYIDIDANNSVGIRLGRNSNFSRLTVLAPNTTTTRVQLIGDETAASGGQIRVAASSSQSWPSYSFVGDTDTGVSQYAADYISLVTDGAARATANNTTFLLNGTVGLAFGTHTANNTTDLGDHISLWGNQYGFNVTGGRLNAVLPNTAQFVINSPSTNFAAFGPNWARFSDGTVINPGISFLDDPDTGITRINSGQISIISNNIERARFGTGGVIIYGQISANTFINNDSSGGFIGNPNDTEFSPSFTWNNSQIGFFRNSSTAIGVSINNQRKMIFNTSGIILAENAKFYAQNTPGISTEPDYSFNGASNFGMYYDAGALRFSSNGSQTIAISSSAITTFNTIRAISGSATTPSYSFNNNINSGFYSSLNNIFVSVDGALSYRFDGPGTNADNPYTIISRQKGDVRYSSISSRRFKSNITQLSNIDKETLISFIDNVEINSWIWGNDLPTSDERYNTKGLGIVLEDIVDILPESVRYQWTNDMKKIPNSIDPMAVIAALIIKIRQLESKINV
jgi:hypothetical protein